MEKLIEAYPLSWPVGYPRAITSQRARFRATFGAARDGVIKEIKMLGGSKTIISTNIPLRRDGLPYANVGNLQDKGVAVYFTYNEQQVVLACDKWNSIADNMQAIKAAINAMRGIERWGVSDMIKRAFTGFKALPWPVNNWWEILEVPQSASQEEIKSAYRAKAKEHHPDAGGNENEFTRIEQAYKTGISKWA